MRNSIAYLTLPYLNSHISYKLYYYTSFLCIHNFTILHRIILCILYVISYLMMHFYAKISFIFLHIGIAYL